MKATIVDLRYKMKDILKALDRNEKVTILYHGKVKGVINPVGKNEKQKVENHPFFGMNKKNEMTVDEEMDIIRSNRSNAV